MAPSFIPIKFLSESSWSDQGLGIRARVTAKGPIRTKLKGYRSGRLRVTKRYFVVHLIDESLKEIAVVAFDNMVDEMYDFLEVGCLYQFYNYRIRLTRPEYRSRILSRFQMIITPKTDVYQMNQDLWKIPYFNPRFEVTSINDIRYLKEGDTVGKYLPKTG